MTDMKSSITELIGNTPMIRLTNIEKNYGTVAQIAAKLEAFNPGGSAKDRVALHMIEKAEREGVLKEGATIIEPTSGNTGIGIALVAAARGYKALIIMPDTMSVERIKLTKAYGAEVLLTDGKLGMAGAVAKAEELLKENAGIHDSGAICESSKPGSALPDNRSGNLAADRRKD